MCCYVLAVRHPSPPSGWGQTRVSDLSTPAFFEINKCRLLRTKATFPSHIRPIRQFPVFADYPARHFVALRHQRRHRGHQGHDVPGLRPRIPSGVPTSPYTGGTLPGSREFECRSPSGSAPQYKLQTLQAAQELHQRRIVTPPSRGSGTRPKRRGRQHLRFRLEVHFRIDVGGVDRDVPNHARIVLMSTPARSKWVAVV